MAKIIDFPIQAKPVRIQIDVSNREENLYSSYRFQAEWLIWIHARTLDAVPALLEHAQRYHEMGQEVRLAAL